MHFKRIYDHEAPKDDWSERTEVKTVKVLDQKTGELVDHEIKETRKFPPVKHMKIIHAGDRWNFSTRVMAMGVKEGWLTHSNDRVGIKTEDGSLDYNVNREPGCYCCHCGDPMESGRKAERHVEDAHSGKKSPDSNNPAGYCITHAYECERVGA